MGASAATYYYRIDRFSQYYEMENGIPAYFVGADREKVSLQEANNFYNQAYGVNFQNFNIYGFDAAFVGDNSNFGLVAPLEGYRYRIGLNKMFGDFDLTVATVDLRKYVRLNKITLAGRILNSMSFGNDNNQFFAQQFVGNPIFIRGYEYNSFYREGDISSAPGDFSIEQLVGSKMAIANFEVRLPFTGPKKLSAVESKLLFSDLNAFFDIGLAYNSASEVRFAQKPQQIGMVGNNPVYSRVPAMSAGLSLRVNVFGYFVLEPYYAIPFQRKNISGGVFGMTFAPGW
jgi:hypothetical protein